MFRVGPVWSLVLIVAYSLMIFLGTVTNLYILLAALFSKVRGLRGGAVRGRPVDINVKGQHP